LAVVLGAVLGHFFLPRYIGHLPPTDRERWLARPKLAPLLALGSTSAEAKRSSPCLFLFPSGGIDEPQTSGTVADCLTLVPNGKKMDVLEINLESGKLFPVKTDLYVADSMPLAFTRIYYPPDEWSRKFQVHLSQVYDPYLTGSRAPYTYSDWLLPDSSNDSLQPNFARDWLRRLHRGRQIFRLGICGIANRLERLGMGLGAA